MLFAATSINYMDRQVIGLLKPTLQNAIGLTEVNYGYIVAAFQVAYAAGLVVAGRLVDRLGTRVGYSLFMCIWSAGLYGPCLSALSGQFRHSAISPWPRRSRQLPGGNQDCGRLVPAEGAFAGHRNFQLWREHRCRCCTGDYSLDHTSFRVARWLCHHGSDRTALGGMVDKELSQALEIPEVGARRVAPYQS